MNDHNSTRYNILDQNTVYNSNINFNCAPREEAFFKTLNNNLPSLFFISLNVQGIISKKEKLMSFVQSISNNFKPPDVILIQETFLANNLDPPCLPNYHPLIHNCRSNSRGGGVGIYIRDCISFSTNPNLSVFIDRVYESISVDIHFNNKRTTLVNLYRPPSSPGFTNTQAFDIFMNTLNKTIDNSPSNTFYFMDSNINLLLKNSFADKFVDLWTSYGFSNVINLSTRITIDTASCIDQIFTNNQVTNGLSGVITSQISDHLPLFIYLPMSASKEKPTTIFKRFFSPTNLTLFKNRLSEVSWESILNDNNPISSYTHFIDIWNTIFELAFPMKKVFINKNKFPIQNFFSKGLLISRARKNSLYKDFLSNRNANTEHAFKTYRNCFNKCIRTAKRLYYEHKIDNCSDPKSSWKILLESTGKNNSKKVNIDCLNINGSSCYEPSDIANHFNTYFASIADSTVRKMPATTRVHSDFPYKPVSSNFEFNRVDSSTISKIILDLQSKNSVDINGVSTKLLKCCASLLIKPLTHLINISLSQGIFPCELSTSRTVPIFKQGCRNDIANYRPISLLPTLSKVYEKVVFNQLYNYLTINKILSDKQFGFRPNMGTNHALLQILNYVAESFNQNKFVVATLLDLSKAFDLINHKILLHKLKQIGLSDTSINWFRSYLSNRKMYTYVNGILSSSYSTLSRSVPQGSILGPLLFLIFINDLSLITSLDCFLYADDNTALTSGYDINIVGPFVNSELRKIGEWLRANELSINAAKTKIIIFSNKKKIADFPFHFDQNDIACTASSPDLITPLERISNHSVNPSVKLLGVYFDEHLTFDTHVDKVCKKMNSALYHINSIKNSLSTKALTKLYYALIHPHIVYCLSIYGFTSAKNRKRIFLKQKQCLRVISKSKFNAHTEPLFFRLKILPFADLFTQRKLLLMHSIAHKYSAVEFPHFLTNREASDHRFIFRDTHNFSIPRTSLSMVQKMPLIDFPLTWNNIDESLKEITSKNLFKKTLKLELLDNYANFQCSNTICMSCMNI